MPRRLSSRLPKRLPRGFPWHPSHWRRARTGIRQSPRSWQLWGVSTSFWCLSIWVIGWPWRLSFPSTPSLCPWCRSISKWTPGPSFCLARAPLSSSLPSSSSGFTPSHYHPSDHPALGCDWPYPDQQPPCLCLQKCSWPASPAPPFACWASPSAIFSSNQCSNWHRTCVPHWSSWSSGLSSWSVTCCLVTRSTWCSRWYSAWRRMCRTWSISSRFTGARISWISVLPCHRSSPARISSHLHRSVGICSLRWSGSAVCSSWRSWCSSRTPRQAGWPVRTVTTLSNPHFSNCSSWIHISLSHSRHSSGRTVPCCKGLSVSTHSRVALAARTTKCPAWD